MRVRRKAIIKKRLPNFFMQSEEEIVRNLDKHDSKAKTPRKFKSASKIESVESESDYETVKSSTSK